MKLIIILSLLTSACFAGDDKGQLETPAITSESRHFFVSLIFAAYGMLLSLGKSSEETEVNTTKVKSPYIGKSYILKAPYFIQLNLPKGRRDHTYSVYVADGEFANFRHNCGNCLDSDRLEKPIRLHYLPIGSKITVVDAFVLGYNLFKGNPDRIYLIIKDSEGHLAEINTLGFKLDVLEEDGSQFDYHVSLLNLIKQIEANKYVDQLVCTNQDDREPILIKHYPFKHSTQIERKIYRFIKDFDLINQVEISNFSTAKNSHYSLSCAQIRFKTINAISLYFYYASDWGMSNDTYALDEYTKIQKTPFAPVNYGEFIKLNDAQILKNYP